MHLYVWKKNGAVGFFSGFMSMGEWGKFHQIKAPRSYTEIPLCEVEPLNRSLTRDEAEAVARI